MNEYKQTLDKVNSLQQTENGALGYSTTGKTLVDLNFTVPSNHGNGSRYITQFVQALNEDLVTSVKWLFYLRDVREGLGERDSFVSLFMALYSYDHDSTIKVLHLIPEYGRWKDVIDLLSIVNDDMELSAAIYDMIEKQLKEDCINLTNGMSVSLLAKWLPSINATKASRRIARRICNKMALTFADYRKILSKLRNYIDVTEVKTCGNRWNKIDYNKVSSNANSRYLKAFLKHDPERRQAYLDALAVPTSGAVMHASNLYPHEVYTKYSQKYRHQVTTDQSIEALWANLKDIPTTGNTMVVVDGSGSMETKINGSSIKAIDVSRSLGVFFSEKCIGEYKDKVIEFSQNPHYIDLSGCKTLADKWNVMNKYDDYSNTNLERVFDLLLATAIQHNLPQSELPQRILIVSDMEFDCACEFSTGYWGNGYSYDQVMKMYQTLFETIKTKWINAGYQMPEIVFWNVNSRTQTIPVQSNEVGVKLVAGFSVNNVKMILSGEIDPWKALKSVLDTERYAAIEEALSK